MSVETRISAMYQALSESENHCNPIEFQKAQDEAHKIARKLRMEDVVVKYVDAIVSLPVEERNPWIINLLEEFQNRGYSSILCEFKRISKAFIEGGEI